MLLELVWRAMLFEVLRTGVRRNPVPIVAAAFASLAVSRADHVDAVAVDLPTGTTAVEFTRVAVVSRPDWIDRLLGLRDAIVGPLGLRTQVRVAPEQIEIIAGRRFGPFKVLSVADDEVLVGDDDKHLRFRTSFAVRGGDGETEGIFTTIVVHENFAGRVYFALIKPFHNIVVASVLRCAALALAVHR